MEQVKTNNINLTSYTKELENFQKEAEELKKEVKELKEKEVEELKEKDYIDKISCFYHGKEYATAIKHAFKTREYFGNESEFKNAYICIINNSNKRLIEQIKLFYKRKEYNKIINEIKQIEEYIPKITNGNRYFNLSFLSFTELKEFENGYNYFKKNIEKTSLDKTIYKILTYISLKSFIVCCLKTGRSLEAFEYLMKFNIPANAKKCLDIKMYLEKNSIEDAKGTLKEILISVKKIYKKSKESCKDNKTVKIKLAQKYNKYKREILYTFLKYKAKAKNAFTKYLDTQINICKKSSGENLLKLSKSKQLNHKGQKSPREKYRRPTV